MFTKPTFQSAMKHFTKAQEELAAAQEVNLAEKSAAQAALDACIVEEENINRVQAFFDTLLGKTQSSVVTEK